jgi:serine protease inhibitor
MGMVGVFILFYLFINIKGSTPTLFIVNRPFILALVDSTSGMTFFTGIIKDVDKV